MLDPLHPGTDAAWASTVLDACPPLHDVNAFAVDDEDDAGGRTAMAPTASRRSERRQPGAGNDFWLVATGFTTPSTLTRGTLNGREPPEPPGTRAW